MKPEIFFENFELLASAPNGVQKLREMILQLAVQGKLVRQDERDGTGTEILQEIQKTFKSEKSKGRKTISNLESRNQLEVTWTIPNTWAFTTLESASYGDGLFSDGDWVESKDQDQSGDIRLIQLADIGEGIYKNKSKRFMNSQTAERLNCTYLKKSDILIARMPDPLARACVFPGDPKRCVTVVDACILRLNMRFFLPEFLVIAINSSFFRNLALLKATGTTRSRISRGNLASFPIPIPPLAEQRRIVAKVDQLMSLCDELEARQKAMREHRALTNGAALDKLLAARAPEEFAQSWRRIYDNFDLLYDAPENVGALRQAILQLAVMGKLVEQDERDEPAGVLVERIRAEKERQIKERKNKKINSVNPVQENEIWFKLPEGWVYSRFGELFITSSGTTPNRSKKDYFNNGTEYWVKTTDLNNGLVMSCEEKITLQAVSDCNLKYYPKGTVCVALYGGAGTIGKSGILGIETTINQSVCGIYPNKFVNLEYLHFYIKSIRPKWMIFAAGFRRDPNINVRIIDNMIFPVPPLNEQNRIVSKLKMMMSLCDELEARLARSQADGERLMEAVVEWLLAR